jgi:hypothetical protein
LELVGRIDFEDRVSSWDFAVVDNIGFGRHKASISMYDFSNLFNLWYLTPSEESHDFGEIPVDSSAVWSVSIENRSQSVKEISSVSINNLSFQCEQLFEVTIEPGESIDLNVTFCPPFDTTYTAILNIQSEDLNREIQLSGTGFEFNSVEDEISPVEFSLDNAYPNPFNSITKIAYQLPVPSEMSFQVFDLSGRKVATLIEGIQPAGQHSINWDADAVTAGIYFVKMDCAEFSSVLKVVLVK